MAEEKKFDVKSYNREYSKKRMEKFAKLSATIPRELYDGFQKATEERGETKTEALIKFVARYIEANENGKPLW
jgi:hypothetical protein